MMPLAAVLVARLVISKNIALAARSLRVELRGLEPLTLCLQRDLGYTVAGDELVNIPYTYTVG
jgi:hypothetical protein